MATPLDAFTCAITHEVMTDPVVTADGQSYERAAIERWLTDHDTSPATNQRLPSRALLPNVALKKAIDEHRSAHASPARSRSNEASRRRALSPDVATRSVRQATHVLTRDQALPEIGYFVYRTEGNLDLFKHPSLYDPAVGPNRERLVLPAGELVVVSQREYGRDSNHIFLKLSTENEPTLQGLYILEQGRYPPYAPTAIQAIVTKEVAVYRAHATTLRYFRPTTSTAGVLALTDRSVAVDTLLAANLHVRDPVTRIEFVRLDNSTLWVPSALLTQVTLRTTRLVVRATTNLSLRRNLISGSDETTVLRPGALAVSGQQTTVAGVCYANVTTGDVSGWCTLRPDDFLPSCPLRLAEKSAGLYIPVVILQGSYFLVVLNQLQSDGSIQQSIKFSLPHTMARQIENCTAKGRHVTHAALGPNAEWYISGTKPDGTGGCAWASNNAPVAFRNVMGVNCRVAFGKYGAYVCDDGTTVYSAGVPIPFRDRLATATARPFVSFGLSGEYGCFIHDTKGGYMAHMSEFFEYDVLDPPPPKRYGRLVALIYSNGEHIKIFENSFMSTGNVPQTMNDALEDFYRRHQRMRNERRQLIRRYNSLATTTTTA
ncbi:hypothetical protein SPRG_03336 [Saprolegnia parasitica CBS 223.65]|uniref:U-box domain-containing protein n=1 Tax=Saprolegnia parasitica (strain CBS 223.65) TaxID=695850 RepID=A0A067CNP0_SAPPC|nr:hypothetical protein SPRG_03336 [Saprolegnia parasitica CBS 223.65]KDO32118.1 hypothetical protein SPRG_03336 [Saprolegnia parasitica CBS 223.65]|eukprot:XP_012197303.1 hypothetical protein SPRG_03336 [Saprolegnia parasitica CBS 223.65]